MIDVVPGHGAQRSVPDIDRADVLKPGCEETLANDLTTRLAAVASVVMQRQVEVASYKT